MTSRKEGKQSNKQIKKPDKQQDLAPKDEQAKDVKGGNTVEGRPAQLPDLC
ncbi:hypothetical protein AB0N09_15200 [Streptomyces erythrochromogenes]|uniref:hypothetical protein n=1 Tax=Streptomyces erythrochromogenes TaxID=285574 RepID=UPI00343EE4C4